MADDKSGAPAPAAQGGKKTAGAKPMPKHAVRKTPRRYYATDAAGVLTEVQVAGVDPDSAGTVGVWGANPPAGIDYGTPSSTDKQDTGTVEEFPDKNGEAQGLLFLNRHFENTYEFLIHASTTPPEFGDVIDTDKYVTRVQERGQAKGWTTLSVQVRTI